MTKLKKTNVFKAYGSKPETLMDKTTRVVRKMVDEDSEKRRVKITRLRNAAPRKRSEHATRNQSLSSIQIASQESRYDAVVETALFALNAEHPKIEQAVFPDCTGSQPGH